MLSLPVRLQGELLGKVPPEAFAIMCAVVGFVLLILGWPLYRIMLMSIGCAFGVTVGWVAARHFGFNPLYLAIPLALVIGVLTLLLAKVGAFCAGGVCAATPVFMFLSYQASGSALLVIAGLAFVAGGVVTIVLWRPVIILCFSVIGATLLTNGFLLMMDTVNPSLVRRFTKEFSPFLYVTIAAITIGGVFFQNKGSDDLEDV